MRHNATPSHMRMQEKVITNNLVCPSTSGIAWRYTRSELATMLGVRTCGVRIRDQESSRPMLIYIASHITVIDPERLPFK